jgi:hypothetical protein
MNCGDRRDYLDLTFCTWLFLAHPGLVLKLFVPDLDTPTKLVSPGF